MVSKEYNGYIPIMTLLELHQRELERFRHTMNLIGPGSASFHFEDCLHGLKPYEMFGHWVDLGSGAGFPGLVMGHQFPELEITLVESRRKRATFLRHVVMNAKLEERIHVLHERVEALEPNMFDGVVSRAFAAPHIVLNHAQSLLSSGGRVVLFLQELKALPKHDGFELLELHKYDVDDKARTTVMLEFASGLRC